jgi:hypothetical protein
MTGYPQKYMKRMRWLTHSSAFGPNIVARFVETEINRSRSILRDDILSPDSGLLSPALQKMKVTPEICMKTKEQEKRVLGVRCQVSEKKSEVRVPKSEVRSPRCKV